VEGVVSALHHIPPGDIWSRDEIERRQREISNSHGSPTGLEWEVVESVPVSETIKTQGPAFRDHIDAYRESLRNLADCGLQVVCYNFMPILDWTRTDLAAPLSHGGTAMKFDLVDFAAFDLFILNRTAARDDFSPETVALAEARFAGMDDAQKLSLQNNVVAGLPGANDSWDIAQVRELLETYAEITADTLRGNLVDFLSEVAPLAEEIGSRLCCHPDDPPFSLLGLPRVMSSECDYAHVTDAVDLPSSGITFCTGSLGVTEGFDPVGFIERLGNRIHFVHLRNTTRVAPSDAEKVSFYEAAHLEGDTDMVATVQALLSEEGRRRAEGRSDWRIPMRPDHGQDLLSDLKTETMPGYPLIGRMRGLAELRGIMAACQSQIV
jgi:mannonate dehydratase